MGVYRKYAGNDEVPLVDGDVGFVGVDEREPALVPKGFVARATNYTFEDGVARPRKGIVPLHFLNNNSATWPINWPWSFEEPKTLGSVKGAGVFSDPNGVEWILIATESAVYAAREGNMVRTVPLPRPGHVSGDVRFVQCFGDVVMFAGEDQAVWTMNDIFVAGFTLVEPVTGSINPYSEDGTENIPQATGGVYMQNRLFIPHSRDLVAASDFLNYTKYAATMADFRINQGSEDSLVALYKFGEQSLIAFKGRSIYLVDNVVGDLSNITQQELTREFGLVAAKAVCNTGADVWFLSQRGVTSIAQTINNKLQEANVCWSDAIYKTIKRINWQYASRACAAFFNGKFYLALPLDDAAVTNHAGTFTGVNNAILVYDFKNRAWWGTHQGANVLVHDWLIFKWGGKPRLGFVSDDGWVCLYDHTFSDVVRMDPVTGNQLAEIETELLTRGYTFPENEQGSQERGEGRRGRRVRSGTAVLNTWRPEFSLTAKFDGQNEERAIFTEKTKNRKRYMAPFGKRDWDESNAGDDHGTPRREDYSLVLGGLNAAEGTAAQMGSGVNFEAHQETLESFRLNGEGRYAQVRITNQQGRVEVKGVELLAYTGKRREGTLA